MTENSNLSAVSEPWTLPYLQFAAILFNGLEKLAEIQRSALAVYADVARNSAETIKPAIPASSSSLFQLAEQAIREFLQIQVRVLDLMLTQSAANKQMLQSHSDGVFEGEIARVMMDSSDCLLNMQKKAIEFITDQNQAFADEILQQNGNSHSQDSAEMIRPDASAIIQAQKIFWDVTLKPFRTMDTGQ